MRTSIIFFIEEFTVFWSQKLSFNIIVVFWKFALRSANLSAEPALRANKKMKEAVRVAKFAKKE